MERTKGLVLLVLVAAASVDGARGASFAFLNGAKVDTDDLKRIDSYVSSTLPIFPGGFTLYNSGTGNRPIIVKHIDPTKTKPLPDPGYYTNLPAVIPRGLEGIASTSFILGPRRSYREQQQQEQHQPRTLEYTSNGEEVPEFQFQARQFNQFGLAQQQQQQQQLQEQQPQEYYYSSDHFGAPPGTPMRFVRNSVVEETVNFEERLPAELRNPFYSDQYTAATLADQSLPAPGEELVGEWNTHKIHPGKVRDLLLGAGLI